MYQHGSHWMDFHEFDTGDFYEHLSQKSTFGYNRMKISDTLHEDLTVVVSGQIKSP
jgi:hypothetical protein